MEHVYILQRCKNFSVVLSLIILMISAPSASAALTDFDGNGKADIVWQDTSGNVQIWLMNGATLSSLGTPGAVSGAWQIAGMGDFEGHGKGAILWQHITGTLAIWFMDGVAISSVEIPGAVSADWQIVGIGDFNGDGKADILWQDTAGTVAIWLMDGAHVVSATILGTWDRSWKIEAVADFDGDGKADILWQHSPSGTVAIWFVSNAAVTSVATPGVVQGDWQIRGAGDFDGDGKADILWQHTSGTVAVWLMSGAKISAIGVSGTVDTSWHIEGVGDFDGDHKADVLWRQSSSGAVAVWTMDGTAIKSVGFATTETDRIWEIETGVQKEFIVANSSNNSITAYRRASSGDTPPIRSIEGPSTGLNAPRRLAVDTLRDEMYTLDGDSITVHARNATGDRPPLRVISGANTLITNPEVLALDMEHGEIFVTSFYRGVFVFKTDDSGDVSPIRSMPYGGGCTARALALDVQNEELYIGNSCFRMGQSTCSVYVYPRTGGSYLRIIYVEQVFGPGQTIFCPTSIALDSVNDEIYITDGSTIRVYNRVGYVVRTISGFSWIFDMAFDPRHNDLFVADGFGDEIKVFDRSANGAPVRTLRGAATGLSTPEGIGLSW